MWEKQRSIADWVYSKTRTLLATLRTQHQPRVESDLSLEVERFVPVIWMCKKQTAASLSSTESEFFSLDAGLHMDGVLALDLWDMAIEALRSTNNNVQPKHTSFQETGATPHSKTKTQKVKRKLKVDELSDVDYVPTFLSQCISVVHF